MNHDKYLSVGALTKYLKNKFDNDMNLRTVYLKGEISNFKSHTTGHFYFTIKDEYSRINAIMFSSNARKLAFTPTDGMKILVTGRVSIYEATGNYQIYVDDMLEDGVGNLYIAFEQLKEKLSKEGLFDSKYKKSIPKIPMKIGIITASTGAAIKDILSTLKRRFPLAETYLFPCLVQGENAAPDIVTKLNQADEMDLDVIILGRGGGSIEDLWPFNEEIVARAVFSAKTPIISAVGHEIDYTIADFVADLRAPTPTGAAEMAVPNLADLVSYINQLNIRLNESIFKKINITKLFLDSLKNSFVIKNPMIMYENKKQRLDNILEKLQKNIKHNLELNKNKLNNIKRNHLLLNPKNLYKDEVIKLSTIIEKLELVNPLNVLKRGFSITYHNDKLIKNIKDIKENDTIKVKLHNGEIVATVNELKEDKK